VIQLGDALELDPQVSLRPEPFGALAYHFGTRRLSFLRSPAIVAVVEGLAEADNVRGALEASGVAPERWPAFLTALNKLADSAMIRVRSEVEHAA
jgi:putative mycofactocin binding protein MftB